MMEFDVNHIFYFVRYTSSDGYPLLLYNLLYILFRYIIPFPFVTPYSSYLVAFIYIHAMCGHVYVIITFSRLYVCRSCSSCRLVALVYCTRPFLHSTS